MWHFQTVVIMAALFGAANVQGAPDTTTAVNKADGVFNESKDLKTNSKPDPFAEIADKAAKKGTKTNSKVDPFSGIVDNARSARKRRARRLTIIGASGLILSTALLATGPPWVAAKAQYDWDQGDRSSQALDKLLAANKRAETYGYSGITGIVIFSGVLVYRYIKY